MLGPGKSWWIVDHHHLARALLDEGEEQVLVSVIAKLAHLPKKRFFAFMESNNWLHAYDAEGKRRDWHDLPRHVGKMIDDPYRSLAGEVRAARRLRQDPGPLQRIPLGRLLPRPHRRRQGDRPFRKGAG